MLTANNKIGVISGIGTFVIGFVVVLCALLVVWGPSIRQSQSNLEPRFVLKHDLGIRGGVVRQGIGKTKQAQKTAPGTDSTRFSPTVEIRTDGLSQATKQKWNEIEFSSDIWLVRSKNDSDAVPFSISYRTRDGFDAPSKKIGIFFTGDFNQILGWAARKPQTRVKTCADGISNLPLWLGLNLTRPQKQHVCLFGSSGYRTEQLVVGVAYLRAGWMSRFAANYTCRELVRHWRAAYEPFRSAEVSMCLLVGDAKNIDPHRLAAIRVFEFIDNTAVNITQREYRSCSFQVMEVKGGSDVRKTPYCARYRSLAGILPEETDE